MRICWKVVISLSLLITPLVNGGTLDENCKKAGGETPGISSPSSSVPPQDSHHDGVLTRGPISCLCGKKPFTPRLGDTCENGVIRTALENFCIHAGGTVMMKKAHSPKFCDCGTTSLTPEHCCEGGRVKDCLISLDPKTWAKSP